MQVQHSGSLLSFRKIIELSYVSLQSRYVGSRPFGERVQDEMCVVRSSYAVLDPIPILDI